MVYVSKASAEIFKLSPWPRSIFNNYCTQICVAWAPATCHLHFPSWDNGLLCFHTGLCIRARSSFGEAHILSGQIIVSLSVSLPPLFHSLSPFREFTNKTCFYFKIITLLKSQLSSVESQSLAYGPCCIVFFFRYLATSSAFCPPILAFR